MSGFTWLNELMTWLARWVPRLTLIKNGDIGVLYSRAARVAEVPAGLIVWWPIVQDLVMVSMRDRSLELAPQIHGTEAIQLVVRWRVRDAVRMVTALNNYGAYLDDRLQASLGLAYNTAVAPKQDDDLTEVTTTLTQEAVCGFGMDVLSVHIAQRGPVLTIKKFKDWAHHEDQTK